MAVAYGDADILIFLNDYLKKLTFDYLAHKKIILFLILVYFSFIIGFINNLIQHLHCYIRLINNK